MKKFYTVYKITNLINNKIYIGAHKTSDLEDGYMGSGLLIIKSIEKYGLDNFKKEYISIFDNAEDMFNMESELVNEEFIDREDTYNIKQGGNGGFDYINANKLWDTENRRISCLKNLEKAYHYNLVHGFDKYKNKQHTEETKKKMSKDRKGKYTGKDNPMFNKKAIKKDGVSIVVNNLDLEQYLSDGWIIGQIQNKPDISKEKNPMFGKCWVTNGNITKCISKDELEIYIHNGYSKGRTFEKK